MIVFTKDSTDESWLAEANGTDFPIQNLPFGIFEHHGRVRAGVAIGDKVLDLDALHRAGLFADTPIGDQNPFDGPTINALLAAGREAWTEVRRRLVALLAGASVTTADGQTIAVDASLRENGELRAAALVPAAEVRMHLPVNIRNYVDFYSSKEHATNVGSMFRDPTNPLLPNWVHIPIGYHGRASSVVVSGTDIRRPCGQTKTDDAEAPTFGPSRLLDFELEMGFVTGQANELGVPIPAKEAPQHIFGMVLVNDWSARDIQKWEYVPLGPFLGKSFATSISPWIVPLDALMPFRVDGPPQEPPVLPYLRTGELWGLDIELETWLASEKSAAPDRITATNFKYMYWSIVQQLVHLASNGANVLAGDLYASGTVSGPTPDSYGSMLELCWRGTKPLSLSTGEQRKFIADGDTVIMRGWCAGGSFRIGFGEVSGKVLPATH